MHDVVKTLHITHGFRADGKRPAEYFIWAQMKQRCNNPNVKCYPYYGGRGIKVSERWNQFENFIADVGPRPAKGYSIERVDNDGDYTPSNCKWIPFIEQGRNRRKSRTP